MPGVVVKEGAHIERCLIDVGTIIGKDVQAGNFVEGEGPYTNHKICSELQTAWWTRTLKFRQTATSSSRHSEHEVKEIKTYV